MNRYLIQKQGEFIVSEANVNANKVEMEDVIENV